MGELLFVNKYPYKQAEAGRKILHKTQGGERHPLCPLRKEKQRHGGYYTGKYNHGYHPQGDIDVGYSLGADLKNKETESQRSYHHGFGSQPGKRRELGELLNQAINGKLYGKR